MHDERGIGGSIAPTARAAVVRPSGRPRDARLALLLGTSPGAILEAITPGDPLELESLTVDHTLVRALLIDPFRVYVRTLARVARDAHANPDVGRPCLHGWLVGRIDRVLAELVDEERQTPSDDPAANPFDEHVAHALGLPLARTRSACVDFNRLGERVRQAFFAVAVDGGSAEQCATEGLGTYAQVQADLALARRTLGLADA